MKEILEKISVNKIQNKNNLAHRLPSVDDRKKNIKDLKEKVSKLKKICQELNPYMPINEKIKKDLEQFNIYDTSDPFIITNKLLVLLEDSIDELNGLKQKSD